MSKSVFVSRTFWVNVLAAAAAVAQALAGQAWCDPEWQAALLALANIALRFATTRPVRVPGVGGAGMLAALAVSGAVVLCGCAGAGAPGLDPERHDAALRYLRQSLENAQTACERAKALHPENAAAIGAQVSPVIAQLRDAVAGYDRAIAVERSGRAGAGADGAWSVARSLLSAAVGVLGPVLINAVAAR